MVDRLSFQIAEETLQSLWKTDSIGSKAVILVGNKTDLVRSRTITPEGKSNSNKNSKKKNGKRKLTSFKPFEPYTENFIHLISENCYRKSAKNIARTMNLRF